MHEKTPLLAPSKTQPLPWVQLGLVGIILLVSTISTAVAYPILPFMVKNFYPDLPSSQIGYKTGFLASAFSGGALMFSYLWGILADKIGRKPVLLLGLWGTFFSLIAFGLSNSFTWAITSRIIWGAFFGNVGVVKTFISEILDESHLTVGFSIMGLQGGLGRLFGPLIVGTLSNPSEKYESLNIELFKTHPYLLPCFSASAIAGVAIVASSIYLEETLDIKLTPSSMKTQKDRQQSTQDSSCLNSSSRMLQSFEEGNLFRPDSNITLLSLIKNSKIIIACVLYGFVAAIGIMGNEIFPLWALNDAEHGGFNLTSNEIGWVCMISAPFDVVFQLFYASKLVARIGGPLHALQVGILLQGVCFFVLPFTPLNAAFSPTVKWIFLCVVFTIMALARLCCFTCVFVLISNSGPKAIRGRINGLGQAIASFARVVSPPLTSILFAWSEGNQLSFPFNYHFVFNSLALFCVIVYCFSRSLPLSINFPATW